MNSPPAAPTAPSAPVAPVWHTVIVLVILLGFSLLGALSANVPGATHRSRAAGYVVIIVMEWAVVAFIALGVNRRGLRLRDLVSGRWTRALDVFRDLGIAIAFLFVSGLVLAGLNHLLKATPNAAIRHLAPQSTTEILLYLLTALTAGFCEEVMFRGYLQLQFSAFTRSAAAGIILQGIVFGAAHGYQGWRYMALIAVFGMMFGALAKWRNSLRPGMFAHFLQDAAGGLLLRHLVH